MYKKNFETILEARIASIMGALDRLAPMPAASGSLKANFNGRVLAGQINPSLRDMPQRLGLERKLAYYRRKLRSIRIANLAAMMQAESEAHLVLAS